ncbi:F-box/LRR-repeat protein At4g14103-like [Arachis duranensis]|uniref:F-box/LRR-repeat protein At4g14103-like n=1 Tax=Arachis duranensis TaxID=130453 RepID=A0A6P5NBR6_ARADU|nr:F-box/LRR-repeat protein At4g14103-like [Arachis duranensis]
MQRKKQKEGVVEEGGDQDYLTALPAPILCNILSFLTTREAAKTSVLSSTWRNIWKTPNNLVLDAHNFLNPQQDAITNISHHSSATSRFILKCDRTWAFLNRVNLYLLRLSQFDPNFRSKIERLSLYFTFRRGGHGCHDLAQWIGFALDRKVDEIDLCFSESHELSAPSYGGLLLFPCEVLLNKEFAFVNSCLKHVRLAHCALAPHPAFNPGFATITTLDLEKVDLVGGEQVQVLLASCHSLEWLRLSECHNMGHLKIEYPSCQKLRHLSVNLCHKLKALVLRSSSLESMEYTGTWYMIETMFDTPNLKSFSCRMVLGSDQGGEMSQYSRLAIDLPQLQTLFLECYCMTYVPVNTMANSIVPTFPNLRHLIITKEAVHQQNFCWIEIVLKGCPILTRLDLNIWTHMKFHVEFRETSWLQACPHSNLKEVTITGIRGHQSEIEIAVYLLQNARQLQKMIIDPRRRVYLGNGKWSSSQVCQTWNNGGRHRLHHLLYQQAQHLSSPVKFFFCCQP